jgi:CRISPR-associated protein Csx16
MCFFLISRHPATKAWLTSHYKDEEIVELEHLTNEQIDELKPHHKVVGTLPVHLAAQVCSKGVQFFSLEMNVPPELRGSELSIEQMEAFGAKLVEYHVKEINHHAT